MIFFDFRLLWSTRPGKKKQAPNIFEQLRVSEKLVVAKTIMTDAIF
jgi:hypothetical protein